MNDQPIADLVFEWRRNTRMALLDELLAEIVLKDEVPIQPLFGDGYPYIENPTATARNELRAKFPERMPAPYRWPEYDPPYRIGNNPSKTAPIWMAGGGRIEDTRIGAGQQLL